MMIEKCKIDFQSKNKDWYMVTVASTKESTILDLNDGKFYLDCEPIEYKKLDWSMNGELVYVTF